MKYIGLVDCNNFFVSCERVFDPSLENKPVAVLSNNDGCIIARSDELKLLGVPMGAPLFKVKHIIQGNNVILRSGNYGLYSDMSRRVMSLLQNALHTVQVYSVDEAFFEVEGDEVTITQWMHQVRAKLKKDLGIPVSVGVSRTKVLAKIACELGKKRTELNGVKVLIDDQAIDRELETFPVGDIWGIGSSAQSVLRGRGIRTALNFRNANSQWVQNKLSIMGLRTQKELQGTVCYPVETESEPSQSILRSSSFGQAICELSIIEEAVAYHAHCAVRELRDQSLVTNQVGVFLKTNPFQATEQYHPSIVIELDTATDYLPILLSAARKAVHEIFKPHYNYRKAGVFFPKVFPKVGSQYTFFDNPKNESKKEQWMQTYEKLLEEFGEKNIFCAARGVEKEWKKKKDQVSKDYTRRWSDLLDV
jgi:DNA polymerase V